VVGGDEEEEDLKDMVEEHLNPHIFSIYLHGFFFTGSRKNSQEDLYLAKESYKEEGEGNKGGREGGRPF